MQRKVDADAVGVFTAADGIHDPSGMKLEYSDSAKGPWKLGSSFYGKAGASGRQIFKFGDQMTLSAQYRTPHIITVASHPFFKTLLQ